MKLTGDLAKELISINSKTWEHLLCKALARKQAEKGHDVCAESARHWCKALGASKCRQYIKPKLMLRYRYQWLTRAVSWYGKRKRRFNDHYNTCHGNEKRFFTRDGTVCRVFPECSVTDDVVAEERVSMPSDLKIYHKTRIPKVMFLAVTARPHPEYSLDGKVGRWPFTTTYTARRTDKSTGTVAGVTQMLQTVNVNAAEYQKVMLQNDGVFEMIRKKMWWFGRTSSKPEAGQKILYQHDGAKPHVAKQNKQQWASHGKMKGFHIEVTVQPAQSPDLNTNDLAFFSSLQKNTKLIAKGYEKDLVTAVKQCWNEYPAEEMRRGIVFFEVSYKSIITTMRDNSYSHHTGSRAAHSRSR